MVRNLRQNQTQYRPVFKIEAMLTKLIKTPLQFTLLIVGWNITKIPKNPLRKQVLIDRLKGILQSRMSLKGRSQNFMPGYDLLDGGRQRLGFRIASYVNREQF